MTTKKNTYRLNLIYLDTIKIINFWSRKYETLTAEKFNLAFHTVSAVSNCKLIRIKLNALIYRLAFGLLLTQ